LVNDINISCACDDETNLVSETMVWIWSFELVALKKRVVWFKDATRESHVFFS